MPQLSHRIVPSSRWNQSTERLPFTARSARTRSSTSRSVSVTTDALVHLEEVAVAFFDDVSSKTPDRVSEVEVDAVLQRADAPAGVALPLGGSRRHIARHEVAVRGVAALEEVVALLFRDLVGRTSVVHALRDPD